MHHGLQADLFDADLVVDDQEDSTPAAEPVSPVVHLLREDSGEQDPEARRWMQRRAKCWQLTSQQYVLPVRHASWEGRRAHLITDLVADGVNLEQHLQSGKSLSDEFILKTLKTELGLDDPTFVHFSSKTHEGRQDLLNHLQQLVEDSKT